MSSSIQSIAISNISDIANPMVTDAQCMHHHDPLKILKINMIHLSTFVILSIQHLTKPSQINLNWCTKLEIVDLEKYSL